MPDEEDAGAAYLAALKQSIAPQAAAAAPARSPAAFSSRFTSASPTPPGQLTGAISEKRKSPRYKCSGSVRLQQNASASSTWATFSDISMLGCYVESAVPYADGTVLDLKLEVNDLRFEAVGEVRKSYPGLGMGISFTKMSEGHRGVLRELIGSIAPRSMILGLRPPTQPSAAIGRLEIPPATNPVAAMQAIGKFFESRHMMGREEFLRILRENP